MQRKAKRKPIYDLFRHACAEKGTNITTVLNACGRSDGSTGSWKAGSFPKLDIVMDIAEYLGISLDELCYGLDNSRSVILDDNEREWLSIVRRIPADRQQMCKDFILTHASIPEKYEEKRIS